MSTQQLRSFFFVGTLFFTSFTYLAIPAFEANAQDDWGVKRDPFDKRIVARYKKILRKKPNDSGALSKLMSMYRRNRSVALLVEEYLKDIKKNPTFSNHLILAYLFKHTGNPQRSLTHFEQANTIKSDSSFLHVMLAKLYKNSGSTTKAIAHYELALKFAKNTDTKKTSLRALAALSIAGKNQVLTTKYFKQYISLAPKDVSIHLEYGAALEKFGDWNQAIIVFKKAETLLRSDPARRIEVIARIGGVLEAKGDDTAAIKEYERGMSLVKQDYYYVKELTARLVEIFRRRQELSVLIVKLEKKWNASQRKHFEWDVLARLYEETGLSDKALLAYRKAIKKAPYELDTQGRLIMLLDNSGQRNEALAQYERVIRIAPGESRFQLELAKRYWNRGDSKKALARAKQIESRFSGDAGVINSLADLYNHWGKRTKALDAYKKLVRIEPNEVRHLENLGEQYHQRGDKKKASSIWRKIVRVQTSESHATLARVYSEHDMPKESLQQFDKAINLSPKKSSLYKGRANVYERLGTFSKAITDWEFVLKQTPDKSSNRLARREARKRIVSLLFRQRKRIGNLPHKTQVWFKEFNTTPPNINSGYYLAEAYDRLNYTTKLTTVLERLSRLRPNDINLAERLVKVYRNKGEANKAVALLLKLAKNTPGRERDFYNKIAEIKTDLQQDEEAIEYVRRALDKSPNDPVAYQRLAERYQAMQKQGKAIKAYEQSVRLAPRKFQTYFILAKLYTNSGKRKKAAALYHEILSKAHNEQVLEKAGAEALELAWLDHHLPALESLLAPLAAAERKKTVYRRLLVRVYGLYVPLLTKRKETATKQTQRNLASKELTRLGKHGLRPLLAALADSEDTLQQQTAIRTLGHLGNKNASAPLIQISKTKKTATSTQQLRATALRFSIQVEALVAAGRLKNAHMVSALIPMSQHKEIAMREAAVFALGMTNSGKAIPALIQSTKDRFPSVRTLACFALGKIEDPVSNEIAMHIVDDDSQPDTTRAACAWQLGVKKHLPALPILIHALQYGNDNTQKMATWALGQLDSRKALSALFEAYQTKNEQIRNTALQAIEQILEVPTHQNSTSMSNVFNQYPMRNHRFDPMALLAYIPQNRTKKTTSADVTLGQEKEILSSFKIALTRHRDTVLRTLRELDSIPNGIGLGKLTQNMKSIPTSKRDMLKKSALNIGTELIPALEALTQHRDFEIRIISVRVLAKLGFPQCPSILASAMSDMNHQVKQASMASTLLLVQLHPKLGAPLFDTIVKQTTAKRWQDRMTAVRILGQWPKHDVSVILSKAVLQDSTGFVRATAAYALARQSRKTEKVYEALKHASDSNKEPLLPVRIAAVKTLQSFKSKKAKAILKRVKLHEPNAGVRQLATKSN